MQRADAVLLRQVRQGARHAQAAMHDTRRPAPALHGLAQQFSAVVVQRTVLLYLISPKPGIGGFLPPPLPLAAALHAHPDGLGGFALRKVHPARLRRRQGYLQIHPVQQGTGQLVAIGLDHVGGAPAILLFMSQPPARTGIHGRHQLEGGGKRQRARRAGYGYAAGFQRFAQRLKNPTLEFGQLVKEKHAVVRQADFPRPGVSASVRK